MGRSHGPIPTSPGVTRMPMSRRRHRSKPPIAAIVGGVIALLLVIGGVWYWMQRDPGVEEVGPEPGAPPPAAEMPEEPEPEPEPLDLPELSASDEFVRGMVGRLSQHPQLAAWLVTDNLVQRFVAVVVDLAGNSNPAANVRFMEPDQPFRSQEVGGVRRIDPDSYRRYDLLAATFASLDTRGTVRLYRQLRPLIDEAWEDLGIPDVTFDEALTMAIRNLLEAEVRDEPPRVEMVDGIYEFSDPALENRRGAEKALLRMGPENTRRIQAKLRDLAREMGIQVP
ncbi:MAG: DUF3014 domain-containing protein [Gemmatimonadales bacterium]|nr:MAG: DUF3014 domain-containing protein [Gemmatimonadales bacterium]